MSPVRQVRSVSVVLEAKRLLEDGHPEHALVMATQVLARTGPADLVSVHEGLLEIAAHACILLRRCDEAIDYARRRADLGRHVGDPLVHSGGHAQQGEVLASAGRLGEAAEAYRQALAALGDTVDGAIQVDPAPVPEEIPPGMVRQLLVHVRRRKASQRGRVATRQRGVLLSALGGVLARAGWYDEALQTQLEAYRIASADGHDDLAARCAGQLAVTSVGLGQHARGVAWSDTALQHLRRLPDVGAAVVAEVQGRRAHALSAAGHTDRALDAVAQARRLAGRLPLMRDQLDLTAASIAADGQWFDEATALLTALIDRTGVFASQEDARGKAQALTLRGIVHVRQGREREALDDLQASLALREQLGDAHGEAVSLLNLALVHVGSGRPAQAGRYVARAGDIVEQLVHRALGEPGLVEPLAAPLARAEQAVHLGLGDPWAAWEAAERSRRGPLTALLRTTRPGRETVPAEPPDLARARVLARRLDATLVVLSPGIQPVMPDPDGPDAAVDPAGPVHVWAVGPDGALHHHTAPASDVAPFVTDDDLDAEALAAALLHPLAGLLTTGSAALHRSGRSGDAPRVVVLPQGWLWGLPYAAMPLPTGDQLVDVAAVSHAPSVHVLETLTADADGRPRPGQARRSEDMLVVGDPDGALEPRADGTWVPAPMLGGPRESTTRVSRLYGTTPLTGPACTVGAVLRRLGSARLVHVEAPALLDARYRLDRPPGMIALTPSTSPAGEDRGQLTAEILQTRRTPARLVVLANCSSSTSSRTGTAVGQGPSGLVRALHCAGVGSVLAASSPMPDHPAMELTGWFHEHYLRTGDPAQALRRAMLASRDVHVLPRIWAAFTLHGSPLG